MILPIIAGVVLRVAIGYAARAAVQYGGRQLSRRVLRRVIQQGKRHGDDILKRERDRRKACKTCKQLDDLVDPCQFLKKGSGRNGYNGGNHNGTKASGKESHHIPAQDSYPPGSMTSGKMPAIAMDPADHQKTMSHGRSIEAQKYRAAQRDVLKKQGIVAAFAMDAADIKLRFGNKYDQALLEASAYVACISKYPDKYPVGPQRRKKRGSK